MESSKPVMPNALVVQSLKPVKYTDTEFAKMRKMRLKAIQTHTKIEEPEKVEMYYYLELLEGTEFAEIPLKLADYSDTLTLIKALANTTRYPRLTRRHLIDLWCTKMKPEDLVIAFNLKRGPFHNHFSWPILLANTENLKNMEVYFSVEKKENDKAEETFVISGGPRPIKWITEIAPNGTRRFREKVHTLLDKKGASRIQGNLYKCFVSSNALWSIQHLYDTNQFVLDQQTSIQKHSKEENVAVTIHFPDAHGHTHVEICTGYQVLGDWINLDLSCVTKTFEEANLEVLKIIKKIALCPHAFSRPAAFENAVCFYAAKEDAAYMICFVKKLLDKYPKRDDNILSKLIRGPLDIIERAGADKGGAPVYSDKRGSKNPEAFFGSSKFMRTTKKELGNKATPPCLHTFYRFY